MPAVRRGHLPGDPRGGSEAHPGAAAGGAAAKRPRAHPCGRAGEARRSGHARQVERGPPVRLRQPVPRDICFEDIFLPREGRKVRNDGTVRWDGGFVEVPGEYVGQTVEQRYTPLRPDLPLLLFVDGRRVCEVHPLDRLANNKRRRRALPQPEAAPQRTLKGPLDYITDEYRELVDGYGDDLDDEEDMP